MEQTSRVLKSAETAAAALETVAVAQEQTEADELILTPVEAAAEVKPERIPVRELVSFVSPGEAITSEGDSIAEAILSEAGKGYDLLVLGLRPPRDDIANLPPAFEILVPKYQGPIGIVLCPSGCPGDSTKKLERILVPTTGADYSRFGAEVAVAIAKGCGASITALHVSAPPAERDLLRHAKRLRRPGRALLGDIVTLGEREGVRVMTKEVMGAAKESAILREARVGRHQLIVIGTKAWAGAELHFGHSAEALIARAPCPVLLLIS